MPARQSRLHTPDATVSVLEARALARTVDISCVRATHTEQDVRRLAAEATRWEFINAHVLPSWVPLLRELLEGTRTLVGSPVGFPSGGASTASKVAEARHLLVDGVQEMDVVMNIGRFLSGDIRYVTTELEIIVGEVRGKVPIKVIIETSLLTEPQIRTASRTRCGCRRRLRQDGYRMGRTGHGGGRARHSREHPAARPDQGGRRHSDARAAPTAAGCRRDEVWRRSPGSPRPYPRGGRW